MAEEKIMLTRQEVEMVDLLRAMQKKGQAPIPAADQIAAARVLLEKGGSERIPPEILLATNPLSLYAAAMTRTGRAFDPRGQLFDHMVVASSEIEVPEEPDPHAGIPISLSAARPSQDLKFDFDDPVFVEAFNGKAKAVVLTAAGQSTPVLAARDQYEDYVWVELRAAKGDTYQTQALTLSQMSGPEGKPYLFNITPLLSRGMDWILRVSIVPPDAGEAYFVDRVGIVVGCFYTKRYSFAPGMIRAGD